MQGFNMGRYHPPAALDRSLSSSHVPGFNEGTNRAQKTTVRFEMPFDTWCTTCSPEALIPQGVRFNARKEKVGDYLTTPIFSFQMKHGACGGILEIRTDPENRQYIVQEGGRRKAVAQLNNEGIFGEILTEEERLRRQEDAFAHIEGKNTGQAAEKTAKDQIKLLRKERAKFWWDPYTTNSELRRKFRAERKANEASESEKAALAERLSLGIEISDATKSDSELAARMTFGDPDQAKKDSFWAVNKPVFERSEDIAASKEYSNRKPKATTNAESIRRDLFHRAKRTARLEKDPWSDFYVPPARSGFGGTALKRKAEGPTGQQPLPDMLVEANSEGEPGPGTASAGLVDYGSDSDD